MQSRPRSHSGLDLDASLLSSSPDRDDNTRPYRPVFLGRRAARQQSWPHSLPAVWRLSQNALEGSYRRSAQPGLAPSTTPDKNGSRDYQSHPPCGLATCCSPGTWHWLDRVYPPESLRMDCWTLCSDAPRRRPAPEIRPANPSVNTLLPETAAHVSVPSPRLRFQRGLRRSAAG